MASFLSETMDQGLTYPAAWMLGPAPVPYLARVTFPFAPSPSLLPSLSLSLSPSGAQRAAVDPATYQVPVAHEGMRLQKEKVDEYVRSAAFLVGTMRLIMMLRVITVLHARACGLTLKSDVMM